MAIEPVTREERFLAAAGGKNVTTPTPITRKEQLLQGIIDAVKSGGATPDVIEGAVNDYLNANPVQPGATTEQAAQIEKNKTDIADLQTEVDELKESSGGSADWAIFADITTTEGVGIIKGTIPEAAKEVLLFFNCPAVETEIVTVKYDCWLDDSSRYTERRQWNNIAVGKTQTSQAYFIRFGDMFTCLSGISSEYRNIGDFRAGNGYDPVAGNTFIICSPYGTKNFPIGTTVKAYWR